MSHFSEHADSVRVDFFKASGKWYTTIAMKWTGPFEGSLRKSFAISLRDALRMSDEMLRFSGLTAICLDPYHEHSHPQSMLVNDVLEASESENY